MTVIYSNATIPEWVGVPGSNRTSASIINRNASVSKQDLNIAAANQMIPIVYGRWRIQSTPHTLGTYQLSQLQLLIGQSWCQGPIQEITNIYFEGMTVSQWEADGHSNPGRYNPSNVALDSVNVDGIESFLGTQSQGIPFSFTRGGLNSELFEFTGGDSPYTDTNPGLAYSCTYYLPTDELTNLPTVEAEILGLKIYDPRDIDQVEGDSSTYEWSPNAALILADFIDRYSDYGIDWVTVTDAADWCSEIVTTGLQASPAQIDDYDPSVRRLIGLAITSPVVVEDYIQVLAEYAGCFARKVNGQYQIIPDSPTPVTKVITESDVVEGSMEIRQIGNSNSPTVVRVNYTQPDGDEPWRSEFAETDIPPSGIVRRLGLNMPGFLNMATAHRQAVERLNKINLTNTEITFEMFDDGLEVLRGDVVSVTHSFGLNADEFRVVEIRESSIGRWRVQAVAYDPLVYSTSVEPDPVYGGTISAPTINTPTFNTTQRIRWTTDGDQEPRQRWLIQFGHNAGSISEESREFYVEAYKVGEEDTILWSRTYSNSEQAASVFSFFDNVFLDGPELSEVVDDAADDYKFRVKVRVLGRFSEYGESGNIAKDELYPSFADPFVFNQNAENMEFSWQNALPIDGVRYHVRAVLESNVAGVPSGLNPHVVLGTEIETNQLNILTTSSGLTMSESYYFLLMARRTDIAGQVFNNGTPVQEYIGPFTIDQSNINSVQMGDFSDTAPDTDLQVPIYNVSAGVYEPGILQTSSALAPSTTFYQFSTSTTASDPGNGYVRFNNSTPIFVTKLFFSKREPVNFANSSTQDTSEFPFHVSLENGANVAWLMMRNPSSQEAGILWLVTDYTDNGGWYEIDVTFKGIYGTSQRPDNDGLAHFHVFQDISQIGYGDSNLIVTKPTDTVKTNDNTVSNDPHLTVPVEANSVYHIDAFLLWTSATTPDIRFGFSGPSGSTMFWGNDLDSPNGSCANGISTTRTGSGGGVNVYRMSNLRGVLHTSASAGSFSVRWAQNTSNIQATTMRRGSRLRLESA